MLLSSMLLFNLSLHHIMFVLKFLPSDIHSNRMSCLLFFVLCMQQIHRMNNSYISHPIKWVYFGVHRFEFEKMWYYRWIISLETVQWLSLMVPYWCYMFHFFIWTNCDKNKKCFTRRQNSFERFIWRQLIERTKWEWFIPQDQELTLENIKQEIQYEIQQIQNQVSNKM